MKRWLVIGLALAALGLVPVRSDAVEPDRLDGARTEVGVRSDGLRGRARIDGVAFDFGRDGDFGRATAPDLRMRFVAGPRADVAFRYSKSGQDGTLRVPVRVGGLTHPAGAALSVDLTAFECLDVRPWRAWPKGALDLVYGLKYWRYELGARSGAGRSAETYAFPLPEIGLAARYAAGERCDVFAAWRGSKLERGDAGALARIVELGARWRVGPRHEAGSRFPDWSVSLGWCADYLAGHDGPGDVILDREGPRLAATASF